MPRELFTVLRRQVTSSDIVVYFLSSKFTLAASWKTKSVSVEAQQLSAVVVLVRTSRYVFEGRTCLNC